MANLPDPKLPRCARCAPAGPRKSVWHPHRMAACGEAGTQPPLRHWCSRAAVVPPAARRHPQAPCQAGGLLVQSATLLRADWGGCSTWAIPHIKCACASQGLAFMGLLRACLCRMALAKCPLSRTRLSQGAASWARVGPLGMAGCLPACGRRSS